MRRNYPKISKGKVIVWGLLSSMSFGGMVWQVFHYLAGLRRLGFDVWYVEDSDRPVYDPYTWLETDNYSNYLRFLSKTMGNIGLKDRWVFREPGEKNKCHGCIDFDGLMRLYKDVDAVFNICGAQEFLPYHENISCRVYIETDPVSPQFAVANNSKIVIDEYRRYHHIFTYAENIGKKDCLLPVEQFHWNTTRPPVIVDWWNPDNDIPGNKSMTTIANWDTKHDGFHWNGKQYFWQKNFRRFIDLPQKSNIPLELSLSQIKNTEKIEFQNKGWNIKSAFELSEYSKYFNYIRNSLGEFTVFKDLVVRTNCGWFSDRSVCYLAAGRPAVVEETHFSKFIPTGQGLFSFSNEEEILEAFEHINRDYEKQRKYAKEIAEEYFKAEKIIGNIINSIGL